MIYRVRLISGLILFTFVAHHLSTHALGLISLAMLDAGGRLFAALWRSLPVTVLLYGTLTVHFSLALYAIYKREQWRTIRAGEAVRITLGLLIIPLLAEHALSARVFSSQAGIDVNYTSTVLLFWYSQPLKGVLQVLALTIVWSHAMIGLYYWLRLKPWFAAAKATGAVVAVLVPVLALLGFVSAGREIETLARDPAWLRAIMYAREYYGSAAAQLVNDLKHGMWWAVGLLLVATLVLRAIVRAHARRGPQVRVIYPNERAVSVPVGTTVLATSRLGHIPHASVCGGRGRCSTCRVRVNGEGLPRPSAAEAMVLARVGAPENVCLACQLRPPAGDVRVTPLLLPTATMRDVHMAGQGAAGNEQEIAIMFVDVRDYTRMTDGRLPYDVVFILNRYFAAMGAAVEAAGGQLDKFIGDGVMALFGLESDPAQGCRDALAAARGMARARTELNASLASDLPEPIRIGIGIHVGSVITGEMGYSRARQFTAIGRSTWRAGSNH
jgi:adenylate cyclase